MECYVRMSYENAAFYRHACSWSSGIFRRGLVGVKTSSMTWRKFFHHVISSHHLQSRTMILALLCIILPTLNLPRRLQRLDLGIYGASTLNPVRWETMALTLSSHTHTHARARAFNCLLSGTTQVSRYQKGKTNLDFTEAWDSEWQWHQLGRMQVCTSLQTDNHASTPPLSFFAGWMPFLSCSHYKLELCVKLSMKYNRN